MKATLEQLDRRAQWVIDRWDERPSLRYGEMCNEVRRTFECGKTAGEKAIQRAYEILNSTWSDPRLADRISSHYMAAFELAQSQNDPRSMVRAMDSMRRHLGLGAPDRVEHSGDIDIRNEQVEDLTDEELRVMAKVAAAAVASPAHIPSGGSNGTGSNGVH